MAEVTLYDPSTLKRVPVNNHDAQRRQKELDAVLAKINVENQVGQPGNAPSETTVIDLGSGQSPDPTNALSPTVIEIPSVSEPVAKPAPVVVEPAAIPTVSAEEYAKMQKQYREASQALTPALQKAAALHNELKEERTATRTEITSLKEQLAEITNLLKQGPSKPVTPAYQPELDTELDSLDPIVADRLRRLNQSTNDRIEQLRVQHQQELQSLREREQQRQNELSASMNETRQRTWDEVFTKLVPDYTDFLPEGPKGPALVAWAASITEHANAIANPRAHTPFFVAKVVNEFKSSLIPAATPARQPSQGDMATRAIGNAPTRVELPEPESPLSEYEIRNAQSIMDKMMRDATNTKTPLAMREQKLAEAKDFMSRFERLAPK